MKGVGMSLDLAREKHSHLETPEVGSQSIFPNPFSGTKQEGVVDKISVGLSMLLLIIRYT